MKNYKQAFLLSLIVVSAIPAFADNLPDGLSQSSLDWLNKIRNDEAKSNQSAAVKSQNLPAPTSQTKKRKSKPASAQQSAALTVAPQGTSAADLGNAAANAGIPSAGAFVVSPPPATPVKPVAQQKAATGPAPQITDCGVDPNTGQFDPSLCTKSELKGAPPAKTVSKQIPAPTTAQPVQSAATSLGVAATYGDLGPAGPVPAIPTYTYTQWSKGSSPGHFALESCDKDHHCQKVPDTQEFTQQDINTCNDRSKQKNGSPLIGIGVPPAKGQPVNGKLGVVRDLTSNLDTCKRLLEVAATENDVYDYTKWEKGSKPNQYKLLACAKDKPCQKVLDSKEFTQNDIRSCNKHIFPSLNGGDSNLLGVNLPPQKGELVLGKGGSVKDLANSMRTCAESPKSSEDASSRVGQHEPASTNKKQPTVAETSQKGFFSSLFSGSINEPTDKQQASDIARVNAVQ